MDLTKLFLWYCVLDTPVYMAIPEIHVLILWSVGFLRIYHSIGIFHKHRILCSETICKQSCSSDAPPKKKKSCYHIFFQCTYKPDSQRCSLVHLLFLFWVSRIANSTSFIKSKGVKTAYQQQMTGNLNLFLLLVRLSTEKLQVQWPLKVCVLTIAVQTKYQEVLGKHG